MGKSIREYVTALGHCGWAEGVDVLSGITGAYLDISSKAGFPMWLWILLLALGMAIAPFVAYHKLRIKRDEIQRQLDEIRDTQPRLEFIKAGDWQFYQDGKAIYGALQIWFVNKPRLSSDDCVARDVTSMVAFYDEGGREVLSIHGCFIEAEAYDWAGNIKRLQKIDSWEPNDEPRKLQIALRWPSEESAYGFEYTTKGDGKVKEKEIPEVRYYVEISFRGTRVNQPPFWFIVDNPGQGGAFFSCSEPVPKPVWSTGYQVLNNSRDALEKLRKRLGE